MAKLIKVDGTTREVFPKNIDSGFTLDEVYGFIGGDIVQAVTLNDDSILLCHEEGKIIGLPFNRAATIYVSARGLVGDPIVGDVVIASQLEFQ